jgi:hypothetical protein
VCNAAAFIILGTPQTERYRNIISNLRKDMSLLTTQQISSIEEYCNQFLKRNGIRFVGIINNKGRLIAGGFKKGIQPYENDEKRQMMYMELVLDLSMRKEFDSSLGKIQSITSRRDKANITSIPLQENLLLISTETFVKEDDVIAMTQEIFRIQKVLSNESI